MEWGLALAAALAVVAVFFVARPFLRDPAPFSDRLDELDPAARRRLELAEQRDRALAALKELEFDHRTGKVSDEDYRRAGRAAAPAGRRGVTSAGRGEARPHERIPATREPLP